MSFKGLRVTKLYVSTYVSCLCCLQAWRVVLTNMLQVATVNSVGDLMLFLAKVAITGIVCCIALPVMHADPTLHLYAVPLIVTAVFAYFITHCVFSVYEVSVEWASLVKEYYLLYFSVVSL